jgi:hypothetical protein
MLVRILVCPVDTRRRVSDRSRRDLGEGSEKRAELRKIDARIADGVYLVRSTRSIAVDGSRLPALGWVSVSTKCNPEGGDQNALDGSHAALAA